MLNGKPMPIQGTGKQTRSMTFVDDAIELLRMVMERPQSSLQPINIGNDDERSVEDIARTLAAVTSTEFNPAYESAREGDPQRRKPDLTLARGYGWAPRRRSRKACASLGGGFRRNVLHSPDLALPAHF